MQPLLFGTLLGLAGLIGATPAAADFDANPDGTICEVSYTPFDPTGYALYPHIVVFVFDPYVGQTQAGPAPTPTPHQYEEVYAFCASLLASGYAPASDPMDSVSITGFTSVSSVCSFTSPDGTVRVHVSAGGPRSYLPSIQAAVNFCAAYDNAAGAPGDFPTPSMPGAE